MGGNTKAFVPIIVTPEDTHELFPALIAVRRSASKVDHMDNTNDQQRSALSFILCTLPIVRFQWQ